MSRTLEKVSGTSAIACADSIGPYESKYKLKHITVKWNTAPTTSQSLTLTLNSATGAAYDCVIYSVDPSVGSLTSLWINFEDQNGLDIAAGDAIDLAYLNTDTNTVSWVACLDGGPTD